MFREKNEGQVMNKMNTDNATVLKEDASFEGKLIFEGNVLVNGKFKGEVFSSGELVIGKTGYVEGQVEIGSININGEVNGNITAKNKIVINAPAVVRGDIVAPSLIIEEGAVFEGNCSMGRSQDAAARTRAVDEEEQASNVVDFQHTAE